MSDLLTHRLAVLQEHPAWLADCQRGLEKEGLRTLPDGHYALTPHPAKLGSALTHPHITTDYAEALLELITDPHENVDRLLAALDRVHRVTVNALGDEILWTNSMPTVLPKDDDIPIGWYGDSNPGLLKHVYRRGLAYRYGKPMQCIAGIHYNFSFPEAFWDILPKEEAQTDQDRQSEGYVDLIRNFMRHGWLLMYLFGASPALNRSFLEQPPAELQLLGEDTLYLPWATSLRMSDLGYQSEAQSTLTPCYNDLGTFLLRLYEAVTTPWPAYEAIGDRRDGEWIQLNCNLLQIENEYYSAIRPKRASSKRPITALMEQGIQYVEVRCMDINPFEPLGISAQNARFLDVFLTFCALEESPYFGDSGYCQESAANFRTVVREGRRPGLTLKRRGESIGLAAWAEEIFDGLAACAQVMAQATGDLGYIDAIANERRKVADASLTPSAQVLSAIRDDHGSFQAFALEMSRRHTEAFRKAGLSPEEREKARHACEESVQAQRLLEEDKSMSFDDYLRAYNDSLHPPA